MSTPEAGPSWSDIASWYDDLLAAGSGPHETAVRCLLGLLPALDQAVVLDVACGQGLATRALAVAGARRVVGVDSSEAMIDLARRYMPPHRELAYVVDDAQQLATLETATFDGATCQLGLMDIEDLGSTLTAIHRVLKPNGWFVFVIGHPCFLAPDATPIFRPDGRPGVSVTGYFEERFWRSSNPNGVRRAGNHHRTLSSYLNALAGSGFTLESVAEPIAGPLLARQQPAYEEVPIFFAGRVRRR